MDAYYTAAAFHWVTTHKASTNVTITDEDTGSEGRPIKSSRAAPERGTVDPDPNGAPPAPHPPCSRSRLTSPAGMWMWPGPRGRPPGIVNMRPSELASLKRRLRTSRPGVKGGCVAGPQEGGLSAELAQLAGSAPPPPMTGLGGHYSCSGRFSNLPKEC